MYVKLFSSLYQGTLRGKSDEILVFTNLLAYADQHGIVDKHFKAIADETGLDLERVKAAVERLESPDSESRSPEMNGCRIVRMDEHRVWGWRIVNYGKYRNIRSEDDRREQNRLAQERYRERQKVSKVSRRQPPSAQAEAEGEVEAVKSKASAPRPKGACAVVSIPLNDGTEYGVTQEQVDEFAKLYPAVDVPQTLNEIRGWNLTHAQRRKTKRGVLAHLNSWLSKEQNRGPQKR